MRSVNSGPPGVRSNKISFNLTETNNLRDAGQAELQNSGSYLHVAAIRFSKVAIKKAPGGRHHWKCFQQKSEPLIYNKLGNLGHITCKDLGLENPDQSEIMSDPYEARALYLLELQQPYPGDENYEPYKDRSRFIVYRISDSKYILYDLLVAGDGVVIPDSWVVTNERSIAQKYAMSQASHWGIDLSNTL